MTDGVSVGAGRFAPTPTGRLHLGNARTALLAWLWARRHGLRTVLRMEDLDPLAVPSGCVARIYADLDWLGLTYDEEPRWGGPLGPYQQSERAALYDGALESLNAMGLLYACACSRKEVLQSTQAPHAHDEGPIYPGTCRPVSGPRSRLELLDLPRIGGRRPALRLDVARALERLGIQTSRFEDQVRGSVELDVSKELGDFVVRRADGLAAYQVACAFDDDAMSCTQVLRGSDLVLSAVRQVLLLSLWERPLPSYAHVGLVLGRDGERLSKRDDALALETLRTSGLAATDVRRRLTGGLGLPDTGDLAALVAGFEVGPNLAPDVLLEG